MAPVDIPRRMLYIIIGFQGGVSLYRQFPTGGIARNSWPMGRDRAVEM